MDFSREPRYESSLRGRFDPGYMPFWKEPVNATADPTVREIIVLKCGRAGGSENVLLIPLRWHVCRRPVPIMYASAQEDTTEQFMDERIFRGMALTAETAELASRGYMKGNRYELPHCHIICAWSKSISGFKQRGAGLCLADEISAWPDIGVLDMMRKRMDTQPFPHLIAISSPDPRQKRGSDDDPIFAEYEATDQREWFMPDPSTGTLFKFEMGGPDVKHGVKWDKKAKGIDGTWDIDSVRESAHYVTPDGTRIDECERLKVIASGHWVATNPKHAQSRKRGYKVPQFLVPFESGQFGHIASRFLESKAKGKDSLRTFVYEVLAEKWKEETVVARDDALDARSLEYGRGGVWHTCDRVAEQFAGKIPTTFLTVDVQKFHVWWLARSWMPGGDSGLVDWGSAASWEEIDEIATRVKADKILCDNSYAARQQEVYEESYQRRMIPCMGRSQAQFPFRLRQIDPFEGKTGGGRFTDRVGEYTWNPDIFKELLLDMIMGQSERKWWVYKGVEREYVRQVLSEECVDGAWQVRRGRTQNHLWDAEVLQLLAATINGIHRLPA